MCELAHSLNSLTLRLCCESLAAHRQRTTGIRNNFIVKVVSTWKPQHFRKSAPPNVSKEVIDNAIATAKILFDEDDALPPLFTLGHLASSVGLSPDILRRFVERKDADTYRTFFLQKNSSTHGARGYRVVSVPTHDLKIVQRWISDRILSRRKPHHASKAYSPGSDLIKAVSPHLGCRWLVKMDITAFFDSISEIAVQHTFRRIGYQPLMAFELARLCTRTVDSTWRNHDRWKVKSPNRFKKISSYQNDRIGFLPQGAPSSPMLANLVMHDFDDAMESLAKRHKFSYSRYADDLSFSTRRGIQRSDCINLVHDAYTEITKYGLTPNLTKTKIAPPGSRKLLLGLLIDRPDPRLTKEFRKNLRMHLYYLQTKGPIEHAKHRDFDTVYGLRNYLFGLAYFARQIDSAYGSEFLDELKKIDWPV